MKLKKLKKKRKPYGKYNYIVHVNISDLDDVIRRFFGSQSFITRQRYKKGYSSEFLRKYIIPDHLEMKVVANRSHNNFWGNSYGYKIYLTSLEDIMVLKLSNSNIEILKIYEVVTSDYS